MAVVLKQEGHHAEALGSAAEAAVFQAEHDCLGVHWYLDYV
jgi:hypothetical protein